MGRVLGLVGLMLLGASCATTNAATQPGSGSTITKSDFDAFMRAHTGPIRECYEAFARSDSALQGRVVARFVITPAHHAERITIGGDSAGNDGMSRCMRRAIASWTFPFDTPRDIPVEQPYSFDPNTLPANATTRM